MKKRQQFKIETIEELETCFENLSPWYWSIGTEKQCFDDGYRWVVKDEDGDIMLRNKPLGDYETIENPLKKSIMMNKLKELIEKKDMESKRISIEVPSGCEARFDEENKVLIISKKKEEVYIPDSICEIGGRGFGFSRGFKDLWMSTEERSNAICSLIQLVEMRDAANGDWKANWRDDKQKKYCIEINEDEGFSIDFNYVGCFSTPLSFKSYEIAEAFLKKHIELIKKAEELI